MVFAGRNNYGCQFSLDQLPADCLSLAHRVIGIFDTDPDDFIFVMSVTGTVNFQPQGDFYGSVAGDVNINLQPGSSLFWNGAPPPLKYPGAEPSDRNVIQAIRTWEISVHKG